jgi:hypothetical protein
MNDTPFKVDSLDNLQESETRISQRTRKLVMIYKCHQENVFDLQSLDELKSLLKFVCFLQFTLPRNPTLYRKQLIEDGKTAVRNLLLAR